MPFRGQADSRWKLDRSAFRPGLLSKYSPQPPLSGEIEKVPRRRVLGWHLKAELRAVQLFLDYDRNLRSTSR